MLSHDESGQTLDVGRSGERLGSERLGSELRESAIGGVRDPHSASGRWQSVRW